MSKPESCILCCLPLEDEKALECGHWLHLECVKKHFKPECPICRRALSIKVNGTPPDVFLPFNPHTFIYNSDSEDDENKTESEEEDDYETSDEDMPDYRRRGYLYADEDPEYDEENPCGDEYEYENSEEET